MEKKRLVKDYDKLPDDVILKVKQAYPHGYVNHLITYTSGDGLLVSALPFETEEFYYLIRMTIREAKKIIQDDDDYNDEGNLKDEILLDEIPDEEIYPEELPEDDDEED